MQEKYKRIYTQLIVVTFWEGLGEHQRNFNLPFFTIKMYL